MGGEPEQRFERNMAIEATVIAKHEFVEIRVNVFTTQAMICAEGPSLEQRESAMTPRY